MNKNVNVVVHKTFLDCETFLEFAINKWVSGNNTKYEIKELDDQPGYNIFFKDNEHFSSEDPAIEVIIEPCSSVHKYKITFITTPESKHLFYTYGFILNKRLGKLLSDKDGYFELKDVENFNNVIGNSIGLVKSAINKDFQRKMNEQKKEEERLKALDEFSKNNGNIYAKYLIGKDERYNVYENDKEGFKYSFTTKDYEGEENVMFYIKDLDQLIRVLDMFVELGEINKKEDNL